MSFLGPSRDAPFSEQLAAVPRSRWIIAGLSVLVTIVVMTGFLLESRSGYSGRVVKVVFFNNWAADRSVADVHADRAAEAAKIASDAAQSRAYVATLPPAARTKAQAQYDAYVAALPAWQRPVSR